MAGATEARRKTPALAELRTESMESQCPPPRVRRLESIISSGENCHDFHQDIQQLLVRLGEVEFHNESILASAFSDLQTLWKISRHGALGNLRAVLADLITEDENVRVFKNTVDYIAEVKGCFEGKEEMWRCIKHVLCVMWNCTDVSTKLCRRISETGILSLSIQLLTDLCTTGDFTSDDKKHFQVKAFLGLLHNCIRNCSECKDVLLQGSCVSLLPKLFYAPSPMVKAKALMVTSYLVNEQENSILNSSEDTITFIVQVLADSSKSRNHISSKYGMSCLEIMKGLNNIAMNDNNKVKIVAAGGLKLYAMLVVSEDEDEREMAALGVWTLSFAVENKARIIQEPGAGGRCVPLIAILRLSLRMLTKVRTNTSSAHHARGALWELFHGIEKLEMSGVDSSIPHVMISYQWDSQKMMIKVKDSLVHAGFKVWMDVEHMTGSTLEAMALAVERASVCLICMSDKYKASPSCRTESEYIFRLHKEIVPLRLQPGYRPDGWLGILVGSHLYFDFSNEDLYRSSLPKLIKELGQRGKIHLPPVAKTSTSTNGDEPDTVLERRDSVRLSRHAHGASRDPSRDYGKEATVEQWAHGDVVKWLADHKLGQVSDRFSSIDGPLLLEMRRVRKVAPEFFYRTLQHDLRMDLATALRFSQMLGKLV
ncbi:uncharacterized protein LOC143290078 [Babylonia areolata]|uniref:uncharacterized protein LOC143290078 n=1 Tax=Babylonia areolata TaxID=304850 RepID=UPI003FD1E2FF